ncbi:hypothetical protein [Sorangium sp. So ce1078]|uniref:hypothetical protein n=1 Tax=Sorangium sp. So ce1078 TaxID=3133329 RepID=UPI003F6264D0
MSRTAGMLVAVLGATSIACVSEMDDAAKNRTLEMKDGNGSLGTVDDGAAIGDAAQALASGWIDTDRGRAPVSCQSGSALSGFVCHGRNCGVLAGHCLPTGARSADTHWTPYFSEETNQVSCAFGQVVSGFACRGKYCDDVSLQCSHMEGRTHTHCDWTPRIRSGSGEIFFPEGYFAAGARCFGGFCSEMDFYICRL